MTKSFYLYLITFSTILCGSLLTSCQWDNCPNERKGAQSLAFDQQKLLLSVGQTAKVNVNVTPSDAHVDFSVENPEIISLEKGIVKGLKEGNTHIIAQSGKLKASLLVEVKAGTSPATSNYYIPYLRFFDSKEKIKEYEANLGHILKSDDKDFNLLVYEAPGTAFSNVSYIVGGQIQLFCDETVLRSESFLSFMKENGFDKDGEEQNNVQKFTSPYKTVRAFAIVGDIANPEGGTFPKGMCFQMVPPVLKEMPYPILNWSSSMEDIIREEEARGFKKIAENSLENNKKELIFAKKEETKEFTELFAPRYTFKDGKLLKAVMTIAPAQYVFMDFGEGFQVYESFVNLAKNDGFEEKDIDKMSIKIYKDESKKRKFFVERWNINLNGQSAVAAGLAFIPFDGPDYVE